MARKDSSLSGLRIDSSLMARIYVGDVIRFGSYRRAVVKEAFLFSSIDKDFLNFCT